MRVRTRWFFIPAIIICIGISTGILCQAKVYIDIDSPSFQKYPIAVTPFRNQGTRTDTENLSTFFTDRLSSALDITGYFKIIDIGGVPESERGGDPRSGAIDFSRWSQAGADLLVKGGFEVTGGVLTAEFRLFDVVEGRLIAGKKYWGKPGDAGMMVMKFAREILLLLTGQGGVFDTKIAFVGKKAGRSEIYSINFDGSGLQTHSAFNSLTLFPHWTPDGKYLSFTSYKGGNPDCYLMNMESGKVETIANFKGLNLAGPWSTDGARELLVLSRDGNEEIYIWEREARELRRVTTNSAIDVSPVWSPDGGKIAFVSNRSGTPQIFVMSARGENIRRLTFEGSYNTSPAWSPAGGRIAFEGMTNGHFQLFLIDEDGSNFMQLTFEKDNCESPGWSPDGRYIAFTLKKGAAAQLAIIGSNGMNLRVLNSLDAAMSYDDPSWSSHILY